MPKKLPSSADYQWASPERLKAVWTSICDKRRTSGRRPPATGVDGMTAVRFQRDEHQYLNEISRRLTRTDQHGSLTTYRFATLLERRISNATGNSRRIFIPRIRDQIVLRAINEELVGTMESCLPNARLPQPRQCAKSVITEARLKGRRFVGRFDIRNFFATVPHLPLVEEIEALRLAPVIKQLLLQIIRETPHRPFLTGKESDEIRSCGLPTGTSVSGQLAHLYLRTVDDTLSTIPKLTYIRFADDILIATDNLQTLNEASERLGELIHLKGLELQKDKGLLTTFEDGFEYLGFKFEGDQVFVPQKRLDRWLSKLHGIRRRFAVSEQGEGRLCLQALNREISGVTGRHLPYYSLADNISVYRVLDSQIRRLVGGIIRRSTGEEIVVTGAHDWVRRYKKNFPLAAARAIRLFGTFD
jgi:RNA-directed DNA polymerase